MNNKPICPVPNKQDLVDMSAFPGQYLSFIQLYRAYDSETATQEDRDLLWYQYGRAHWQCVAEKQRKLEKYMRELMVEKFPSNYD